MELDAERYWELVLAALDPLGASDDRRLVCVVGSLNQDTTLRVPSLPTPGETILRHGDGSARPGGKGANQAAAAAAWAPVPLVGAVGETTPGAVAGRAARTSGSTVADGRGARRTLGTGAAVMPSPTTARTLIVVDPGANAPLDAAGGHRAVAPPTPAS